MSPFFSSSDKKPALIATTSATTRIIHPPEDISLVSYYFLVEISCFFV